MSQYPYPIPGREDILGFLRTSAASHGAASLAAALGVKPEEMDGLMRRLGAMERDGQIRQDRSGHIQLVRSPGFIAGRVSAHRDGYGFLIPDDASQDIFLSEQEMQKVLHGDQVQVRVTGTDYRGRLEGVIVEVVARAHTRIIGRLHHENGVWVVIPEDRRIRMSILLTKSPFKVDAGQVVSVELTRQPSRFVAPLGHIVEVLGDMDAPGMEIDIAVRKYGVPHLFSDATTQATNALADEVLAADLVNRVDLRDIPFVTIDGEDARDFDDAVYCEPCKIKNAGAFRLLVAIADVSHYVKPGQALDVDALQRSTSVYFPRRVIPMLPEKLSNGLCSLNPGVDRLTLVCDAVIDTQGTLAAYQFYPAVIHSAARLTYTEVAAILDNPKGKEATNKPAWVPHVLNLYSVYLALLKARHARGAIDFETVETHIVCNEEGKIEHILPRMRNEAHKLIEECMLAANVCAADLLERHEHPGLYRVHALPTEEKLEPLRTFLKQVGLYLGGGNKPAASDYAALMAKVKNRPDATLLQTMLLRSMQQAVYSPENIGHFGLSYDVYTHFTSPIRRYPDLLTHRAIKAVIQGKRYRLKGMDTTVLNTSLSNAARKKNAQDKAEGKKKAQGELALWEALGTHCSANERRADEAARDVEAWLKCYFMRDKIGQEFGGTISGVAGFGIFVQLDELYIEGMVHVTELGTDYFKFDEARHALRGERTGVCYQLTDRVTVQLARVDLDTRKIELRLAGDQGKRVATRKTSSRKTLEANTGKTTHSAARTKVNRKKRTQ